MDITENKKERIKELVTTLNEASKAYYQESKEIMSNYTYDALYDELVALEKETGIVLSNSPTVKVGYEIISQLPKETHEKPMLSLDKTKSVDELAAFLKDKEGVLSWKLDGLTVVLTYENGALTKAVTRGNGRVGEIITPNAKVFKNVPLSVPFKGKLVIRGEAIIKYSDFERINNEIEDVESKYKNPRNLCSGSVRQLNSEVTAKRSVNFFAFSLVLCEGKDFNASVCNQFDFLEELGFDVVEHFSVTKDTVPKTVEYFANKIETYDLPSDGLVLVFNDYIYGESLGSTAKFPRSGLAFKWKDETAETRLVKIEWSASRTGLINPVAVFEPVELEGTTVSRASVHNVSVLESLKLGYGDTISVYKANMIIPQIAVNLSQSGTVEVPSVCPVCGGETKIIKENESKVLYCTNPLCQAKNIKKFAHFVSRDAMNIEGLSEETLEKFVDSGYVHEYADIYKLDRFKDEIVTAKGFGEKSYVNYIAAINKSRNASVPAFINALGITNVGVVAAKIIAKYYDYDIEKLVNPNREELSLIDGIGPVIAASYEKYMTDLKNREEVLNLLKELNLTKPEESNELQSLAGMIFVITGDVYKFANRNELKKFIEDRGGKVVASVSSKTTYLINNDVNSSSNKNKKAKELGIKIIDEDTFLTLV